jgi:hypothetical protein
MIAQINGKNIFDLLDVTVTVEDVDVNLVVAFFGNVLEKSF